LRFDRAPFAKVWRSISNHGFRAGLEDAAARWARRRLRAPYDMLEAYGWVVGKEHRAALPPPNAGPLRINWLVPTADGGGKIGGLFNVYRTIRYLERWGHKNCVYDVNSNTIDSRQTKQIVDQHYFKVDAEIRTLHDGAKDSDVLVATDWRSAYAARSIGNTAQKFYFVQDLEHLFHPEGSLREFAKSTYQWHFRGITAGKWIAHTLQNEFGMECSPFGFSYDRDVYSANGTHRLPDQGKRVLFYARPETERRGFELGILALSIVSRNMPGTEFVLVGSSLPSVKLPFPAILPGTLKSSELGALYRSCDVALVLSHTNVSLLPLELMACGCAVVSNSGPNVEWLLSNETAQLADASPGALADAVIALLRDDALRARKIAAALAFAEQTDWETETRRIESAFYRGLDSVRLGENCE
jgi:O-antigen biosynthesis protein